MMWHRLNSITGSQQLVKPLRLGPACSRWGLHGGATPAAAPERIACMVSPLARGAAESTSPAGRGVSCRAHEAEGSTAGPSSAIPPLAPTVTHITSMANPYVKHCMRLRTSGRYRSETGRFVLVGRELLSEAVGEGSDGGRGKKLWV